MDFSEFLATGWGMAIFIIVDLAVLVLILALNYKWLFKRVLDVLFSFVFLAVFFLFFLIALLADAIYNQAANAYASLFVSEYYCGKKGKVIKVTTFATERIRHDEAGNLLPESERRTGMGKFLAACGMKYYPCLGAVFAGRLSFVGPRLMTLTDAGALSEEGMQRFRVRPGLVSSLERYGGENLTYPDLFEEDALYAAHPNLFRDISFFAAKIAHRLRGDDPARPYGECAKIGYVDWLEESGAVTAEEAEEYRTEGKARLTGYGRRRDERKDFERRMFTNFK